MTNPLPGRGSATTTGDDTCVAGDQGAPVDFSPPRQSSMQPAGVIAHRWENGTMSATEYLESYSALAAELRRQGRFRKPTGRLMLEFAFHLATFALGIVIAVNASSA